MNLAEATSVFVPIDKLRLGRRVVPIKPPSMCNARSKSPAFKLTLEGFQISTKVRENSYYLHAQDLNDNERRTNDAQIDITRGTPEYVNRFDQRRLGVKTVKPSQCRRNIEPAQCGDRNERKDINNRTLPRT